MGELLNQFQDDEICGFVCSPRRSANRIALWTKHASNEDLQRKVAQKWKELCNIQVNLGYHIHDTKAVKTKEGEISAEVQAEPVDTAILFTAHNKAVPSMPAIPTG